jgi:hypothetical protein
MTPRASSASGKQANVSPDARFAIYFAPQPDSALAQQAAAWFASPEAWAHTVSPRHYGFHATLKPPFALADGHTPDQLRQTLQTFAAQQPSLPLPALQVSALGRFLALTLSTPCPPLDALAARCVLHFEPFRRPAPRPEEGLTPRQIELLRLHGYPYVLDQWKFHMTLTSSIANEQTRAELFETLTRQFTALHRVFLTDLCLFTQPDLQTPFTLAERFPCSQP